MELTAEQIKQALECLAKCGECKESSCEYYMESNDVCMCDNISIAKDTLDYINRLEAENERLREENKKDEAVIEQINDIINPLPFVTDFDKAIKNAKVETIKKFKQTVRTLFRLTFLRRKCYDKIFDEAEEMLLKEMAGDSDG